MSNQAKYCSSCKSDDLNFEEINKLASYLMNKVTIKPKFGIVCGSGLGLIGHTLQNPVVFDYNSIRKDFPYFPISTIQGHPGKLLFGTINDVPVVCFQGRFHFYEGYSLAKCVLPIRLMKAFGVKTVILSNSAGGVNPIYKTGDIMFIKDHINFVGFSGQNPLRGLNCEKLGSRFVQLNDAYNCHIIKCAKKIAEKLEIKRVHEGVYGCVGGPNYETVAEIRALWKMGVDAVGMSTVHEVIAARHCNINCFAFSLITNECVAEYEREETPEHGEILDVAKSKEEDLKQFAVNLISELDKMTF